MICLSIKHVASFCCVCNVCFSWAWLWKRYFRCFILSYIIKQWCILQNIFLWLFYFVDANIPVERTKELKKFFSYCLVDICVCRWLAISLINWNHEVKDMLAWNIHLLGTHCCYSLVSLQFQPFGSAHVVLCETVSWDMFLYRYRESQLVKLDIQINGDPVEALSTIVHRDKVLHFSCYLHI